jgi:AmmeMemoRadiSam system protein A
MTPESKRALLRIARESVEAAARGYRSLLPDDLPTDRTIFCDGAAFVTLHEADGSVRGCVGTTVATKPLVEVVAEMARAAAMRDPRFDPVQPEEVPSLEIEVSVLEEPVRIESLDDVTIGTHGLLVEGRGRRGLLLPQVATERSFSKEAFAEQTCQKAGLDSDAYLSQDVELFRFGAEVFNEHEL